MDGLTNWSSTVQFKPVTIALNLTRRLILFCFSLSFRMVWRLVGYPWLLWQRSSPRIRMPAVRGTSWSTLTPCMRQWRSGWMYWRNRSQVSQGHCSSENLKLKNGQSPLITLPAIVISMGNFPSGCMVLHVFLKTPETSSKKTCIT